MNIREYVKTKKLLCDGAFSTYFAMLNSEIFPEKANILAPDIVYKVHKNYIENGSKLIRTNSFYGNRHYLGCSKEELIANIKSAYSIAKKAANNDAFIACNVSSYDIEDAYTVADTFIEEGAEIILFETLSEIENLIPVIKHIKEINSNIFIITQFCVNQHGYTDSGISVQRLFERCNNIAEIDAIGLNCGVGPSHLLNILKTIDINTNKFITALPNSSYPSVVQDRMVFLDNVRYFTDIMKEISNYADIIGGCCGTNPKYINSLKTSIDFNVNFKAHTYNKDSIAIKTDESNNNSFFAGKGNKKLIAVELDPPKNGDCTSLMETANYLKTKNVDVITFADSPSGRTRADSVLMSIKVAKETGINVMPHICCRDKNSIAISSLLLGAYINDIKNLLVITGDPVPSSARESIKGVFNFDSVKLMEYIKDMNTATFNKGKMTYGGAINYSRHNIDLEIIRIQKKIDAGAEFFLTQPVYDDKDIETLKYIKSKVNSKILVGIMPLVSIRNAMFIKNEISGITIPDWVIEKFTPDLDRATAEEIGINISKEIMSKVSDFADGYYFVIPFNRLSIAQALIK